MTPAKKLTSTVLDAFLGLTEGDPDLLPYLEAAAVLAAFDPYELHPVGKAGADVLPDGLLSRCEPITHGPRRGLWTLPLAERRTALQRLSDEGRLAIARAVNSGVEAPEQRVFDTLLWAQPVNVEQSSRQDLVALTIVLEWVEGILPGLPSRTAVRNAIIRNDLLAPMRALVQGDILGRQNELAQVAEYVFGPPPIAPLFVHGAGGVGKSTLLARTILDSIKGGRATFAYLDLDRPTIRPDRPTALLLHVLDQLVTQLGVDQSFVDSLISEITYAISRFDQANAYESLNTAPQGEDLLRLFQGTVDPLLPPGPLLIVIDTFEEAQFFGPDVVYPLLEFLFDLTDDVPRARVIVAGRALPDEYHHILAGRRGAAGSVDPTLVPADRTRAILSAASQPVNLGVLTPDVARELLRRAVRKAEMPMLSEYEIDEVVGVVGRNPMSLRLAARLLLSDGLAGLRESRSEFLARLKSEKVQALLYGRILRQLHGDDVRKIAYPGLVLRRLTPDVIRNVLAGPCELSLTADRNEYMIFEELANEAGLVERDPRDGSLRHRVDVRRAVLDDIIDNVGVEVIREIDELAVAFYQARDGDVDRAEEIYHRLRLAQEPHVVEPRWLPGVADLLRTAVPEVPAVQRLWLAGKLGVTLDATVRKTADLEVWELQAATSADRWLRSANAAQALSVLRERPDRSPRSPIYLLETEALRLLERWDEARAVARAGVDAAGAAGAVDIAVDLLLKIVVIEESRGDLAAADSALGETEAVAPYSSDPLLRLRVEITRLRIHRKARPEATDDLAVLRAGVLAMITDETITAMRSRPTLLREAAAELGMQDPRVTAAAIQTLGVEVTDDAQAKAFGDAIVHAAESVDIELNDTFNAGASELTGDSVDGERVRSWVHGSVTASDTRSLGRSLASAQSGDSVLGDFENYFRAGVDSGLGVSEPEPERGG